MSPTWKPLHLNQKDTDIPPLLIKAEFGLSSYKVWLTDLTYIWTESVDRRQIIQRAFNIETCIDPSEDASQLRLLLQSIQDALVQRTGTNIDFVRSDDFKELVLRTSTPLPGPLKPLLWRMILNCGPQSILTSEFVIPLLSQQSTAKTEKASLLQQLKNKDNVINKLIEKMQSEGVDLSKVFPGSGPIKPGANARHIIAKSAKGLGEFNLEEWQSRMARDNTTLEELKDLISNTFDVDPIEAPFESQISDSPSYGDWWRNLRRESSQRAPLATLAQHSGLEGNGVEDSDFQTQLTPPKHQANRCSDERTGEGPESMISGSKSLEHPEDNNSTTNDSDSDIVLPQSREALRRARGRSRSARADSVNAAQKHLRARVEDSGHAAGSSLQRKEAGSKPNNDPRLRDETPSPGGNDTDVDEQLLISSKSALRDKTNDTASKPKHRLGTIGGKGENGRANQRQATPSPAKTAGSVKRKDEGRSDLTEGTKRHSHFKASEPARLGKTTVDAQTLSAPRETSQERANRKREQLKRELESKAQAGVKKKRKF